MRNSLPSDCAGTRCQDAAIWVGQHITVTAAEIVTGRVHRSNDRDSLPAVETLILIHDKVDELNVKIPGRRGRLPDCYKINSKPRSHWR